MNNENNRVLIQAIRLIYDNIDQPLTLEEISRVSTVSVSTLKRLFMEATGQSPGRLSAV